MPRCRGGRELRSRRDELSAGQPRRATAPPRRDIGPPRLPPGRRAGLSSPISCSTPLWHAHRRPHPFDRRPAQHPTRSEADPARPEARSRSCCVVDIMVLNTGTPPRLRLGTGCGARCSNGAKPPTEPAPGRLAPRSSATGDQGPGRASRRAAARRRAEPSRCAIAPTHRRGGERRICRLHTACGGKRGGGVREWRRWR
ncbi:hypothetical protein PVAP13_7NG186757 [Panicum virgatum]|uniref:Uncharacterized protein n=1 Tax=Panicum virgatum TaxID=38727 RepID=A0A8T0Q675_PANVG|nr:hypothetical protein PVAP13_7NG186757 [Panicum virgatum]